jgi:hypothetical protein
MLLRLRQVCDHPKLVEDSMDGLKDAQLRDAVAATPAHDARCALCCDLLENPMLAPCCGQCFCRECIQVGLLSMKGIFKFFTITESKSCCFICH